MTILSLCLYSLLHLPHNQSETPTAAWMPSSELSASSPVPLLWSTANSVVESSRAVEELICRLLWSQHTINLVRTRTSIIVPEYNCGMFFMHMCVHFRHHLSPQAPKKRSRCRSFRGRQQKALRPCCFLLPPCDLLPDFILWE